MDWTFVFSANMNFPHLSSFPIVIKLFFIRLYASLPLIYILPMLSLLFLLLIVAMMSIAKNLDEYDFGKTAPEKMNHISCLILKHSQRLDLIHSAYEEHCEAIIESMSDTQSSKMTKVMSKYRTKISDGLQHVHSDCDTILKLTSQKNATKCADNLITKEQKALAVFLKSGSRVVSKQTNVRMALTISGTPKT